MDDAMAIDTDPAAGLDLGTALTAPGPVEAAEPEPVETEDSEKAQVAEMLRWVKVPTWLQKAFEQAKKDREYLHTGAFEEDDSSRASCNELLRSVWAKLALIWPQQPEATCKPPMHLDPPEEVLEEAQAELQQAQVQAQQLMLAGISPPPIPTPINDLLKQWRQERSQAERQTLTIAGLLNRMAKIAHLEGMAQRAALDALTCSLVWVKAGWSEDPNKDFLGQRRSRSDAQDQFQKLRQLEKDYAAGAFDDADARWSELCQLREYTRRFATEQLAKLLTKDDRWQAIASMPAGMPIPPHLLPEPERFCCGTADIVDLENLRLDWARVTSPETVYLGRRMAERVWMSRDEVARTFDLDDDEKAKLGGSRKATGTKLATPGSTGSEVANPADDELEQSERSGQDGDVAVWELWDIEQHRIYWFTAGIDRFLRTEIPEVTRRDFFPYIPLFFNPVSGRFMPISDVKLGRKSQDGLNQALTDDLEARQAHYPWYAVGAGLISDEDIRTIEGRKPNKVVVLEKPAAQVREQIVKMDGDDYKPELYQIGVATARANLERMLGVPSEALQGQSKAKFATQVQVSSDNMLAQSGRNGSALSEFIRQVFEAWADYAAAVMPEAQAKAWLGMWAVLPDMDRSQLTSGMHVDIVSAGNRGQRRQDLEDMGQAILALNGVADAAMKMRAMGKELDVKPIVKRIETSLDVRLPNGLIKDLPGGAPPMQMPPMGGGPGHAPQRSALGGGQPSRQGLPTAEAETGGALPGGGSLA